MMTMMVGTSAPRTRSASACRRTVKHSVPRSGSRTRRGAVALLAALEVSATVAFHTNAAPAATPTVLLFNNARRGTAVSRVVRRLAKGDDFKEPKPDEPNEKKKKNNQDVVSAFCQGTNAFWKSLVLPSVRDAVSVRPASTTSSDHDAVAVALAPPETPGVPRPVWLVVAASVPTALVWYGYYKFAAEEELFQHELETTGKVSGCGGYGTLFPFVYGLLVGAPLSLLHVPGADHLVQLASAWILLTQLNLYRRVNELYEDDPPLHEWWALLPPPIDVVVGLRQVHFLSQYWQRERGLEAEKDVLAEDLFPFISRTPRFTLKEFFRTPSMWFWFTKDWPDFDFAFLQDD